MNFFLYTKIDHKQAHLYEGNNNDGFNFQLSKDDF